MIVYVVNVYRVNNIVYNIFVVKYKLEVNYLWYSFVI